ncbi:MAG: hypothetical protein CVV51_03110 [Spirochaetae bacterium HGW-Spirochaetae-7]|jgi:hypothetical protein|nr:MAG: hypothetical protein CVV51_03110 [Spirochaetae bacterium HGW-Spirochaetae-7]
MISARNLLAAVLLAAASIIPSFAQDGELAFKFEGPRRYAGFIPSGADVSLTYSGLSLSPEGNTRLFLMVGAGYENGSLLRDLVTGDPWAATDEGYTYDAPDFRWDLAFIQGLARRNDGDNLVEAFAYYRGRYDAYANELSSAVFPDIHGIFGTSIMGGMSYDSRTLSEHYFKDGMYAEASAEWGPGILNASTDFWRVSGQVRGFLPVFDFPTEGGNRFNAYLAGFAGVDYADGTSVPIYVNQSFGGRKLRDSLGDSVRGYGWNKFDSSFKSVANAELRLLGPSLGLDAILPLLYGFIDTGFYAGFAGSTDYASASGFIASAGVGAAIDLADVVQLGAYAGFRLMEDRLYYPRDAFFWGIMLFSHF